jgi:UbiD family decarboxylase
MQLREFLEELAKNEQLVKVEETLRPEFEIGGLSTISASKGGPAFHFTQVEGYPDFSMAGNLFSAHPMLYKDSAGMKSWSRIAISLGFNPKIGYAEMMEQLLNRYSDRIPPMEVDEGPCQEVVVPEKEVDLNSLPIPILNQKDVSRYGNGHVMIVKGLEGDTQEASLCRWMPISKDRLVAKSYIKSHIPKVYQRYASQGKAMPFCIVIGCQPSLTFASGMYEIHEGVDKMAMAGGFNLDSIEVVKAKTNDIYVPADSEIIIEGEMLPEVEAQEGPFAGLTKMETSMQPVGRIKCITMRKDPIFCFSNGGCERSDIQSILHLTMALELLYKASRTSRTFPLVWIYVPLEFCLTNVWISAPKLYAGIANHLAIFAFSAGEGRFDKVWVMDAGPLDVEEGITEVWRKCHPVHGVHIYKRQSEGTFPGRACDLVHYLSKEDRDKGLGPTVYYDSHFPLHWKEEDKATRLFWEMAYPEDIRKKVFEGWKKVYGFKNDPQIIFK